jgi:hypothetical protein
MMNVEEADGKQQTFSQLLSFGKTSSVLHYNCINCTIILVKDSKHTQKRKIEY